MTRSIQIVCRPELASGFALAGLTVMEATTPSQGAERIINLSRDPAVGIVLADEVFVSALPEDVRRALGRRALPMVVPFPGPSWAGPLRSPEDYVVDILRQAIGYRVRLR